MTFLARLTKLGGAKEVTPYTYQAPAFSIPWNTGTKFVDIIEPLRDESVRANDAILQGLAQGGAHSEWEIDVNGYADLAGHWFRSIVGPDTVTPGSSTVLSANTLINATSVSLTATVPSNSILQISDTGGTNLEWVKIGTVTGSGPFSAPITAGGGSGGNSTKFAHTAAGGAVLTQSTHLFKQNRAFNTVWPTYSFTTDDGVDQLGWTGCVCSELGIKIDPKGFLGLTPKFTGMPSISESTFAYAASTLLPIVGWSWSITNNAVANTRGLTMDVTLKRAVEAIMTSDGLQAPREIFAGAAEVDGSYKAIFENDTDLNLFKLALQQPVVHTLTQPPASGGAVLAITMSQAGFTTGEKDFGQAYTQLSQSVSGIANTLDSGIAQISLQNFQSTAY